MPEMFQNVFNVQIAVHVRRRPNGVYEARFRKGGFNISVSSLDYDELKGKFLTALKRYTPPIRTEAAVLPSAASSFADVATRWLELRRPSIKANTYKYYVGLFSANIYPALEGRELRDLKQSDVQQLINGYIDAGKLRTATKIYQALKSIFEFAVGEEILERSPMRLMRAPTYEEKNGCALTLEEEAQFLQLLRESKVSDDVRGALLVLLYTGMRRSELAGARIEDGFISVQCSKVRKGFQARRRLIPITPMLARHLDVLELEKLRTVRPDALTQAFKRLMPAHHLHELRHTFITRCQECGVAREVVSVWAGHAADGTQTSNVYTHFGREFMLREAQKVIYNL